MRQQAFTLVELLITILIIGILTGISYPIYSSYVAHSKRRHTEITMKQLASKLEEYYVLHNTYEGASHVINPATWSRGLAYRISFTQLSNVTFQIYATANRQQANADNNCKSLTLNQSGVTTPRGCWR